MGVKCLSIRAVHAVLAPTASPILDRLCYTALGHHRPSQLRFSTSSCSSLGSSVTLGLPPQGWAQPVSSPFLAARRQEDQTAWICCPSLPPRSRGGLPASWVWNHT